MLGSYEQGGGVEEIELVGLMELGVRHVMVRTVTITGAQQECAATEPNIL